MGERLLEEDLLRQAFAPEKPGADAFLEGVRQRIRSAENEQEELRLRLEQAPERTRVAAGVLPPGLISAGLAAGNLGSKKLGAKALPGLLSVPVASLVVLLLGFLFGLRSMLQVNRAEGAGSALDEEAMNAWLRRNQKTLLASLTLIGGLLALQLSGAVMILLLGSMAVLVMQMNGLRRLGVSFPKETGNVLAVFLSQAGVLLFYFGELLGNDSTPLIAAMVLICGSALCPFFSGTWTWAGLKRRLWTPIPMKQHDAVTDWSLRSLTWAVAAFGVVTLGLVLAMVTILVWPEDSVLVEDEPGASVEELRRGLQEVPGPPGPALDVPHDWFRFFGLYAYVLTDDPPWDPIHSLERYVQRCDLKEAGELVRGLVAERALALWPAPQEARLVDYQALTEALQAVGRAHELEPYRADVLKGLERHWLYRGGFSWEPNSKRRWFEKIPAFHKRYDSLGAIHDAVWLMSTYGVPEGVDLSLLRRYFQVRIRVSRLGALSLNNRSAAFEKELFARIKRLPEYRPPTWLDRIGEARDIVGASLLALLSFLASYLSRERLPA